MKIRKSLLACKGALRVICLIIIFTILLSICVTATSPEGVFRNKDANATASKAAFADETTDSDILLPEPPTGVNGSGSYQLNQTTGDYRFFSEYFINCNNLPELGNGTFAHQTAGIDRKNQIHVYLKKGETAYFGSSVYASCITVDDTPNFTNLPGSTKVVQTAKNRSSYNFYTTGADIVLIKPNGDKEAFDVTRNGAGYIASTAQEKNGPVLNETDRQNNSRTDASYPSNERYTPLSYTAQEDGVYTLLFHSITGWNNSSNPTKKPVTDNSGWDNAAIGSSAQGFNYVSAWDVTVVGANSDRTALEVKQGRAWTNYLALNSGEAGTCKSSLHVNVLTGDGYIYKVDFEEFVPWGFIFFANNAGFTTTDETPLSIYHSFYDNDNSLDNMSSEEKVTVHLPYADDTAIEKTFKVFFNSPSDELPETIKPALQTPNKITNLRLTGTANGISRYMQGGSFTFEAEGASSVTIEMNLRKSLEQLLEENPDDAVLQDYAARGSGVIRLSGPVTHGENSFQWDGTDTHGVHVPVGLYESSEFEIYTEEKNGEIHFPLIDAEGLYGGLTIERLNGNESLDGHSRFDLYYNNAPLAYGTIEGTNESPYLNESYYTLTDGTKTFNAAKNSLGGISYFKTNSAGVLTVNGLVMLAADRISTLRRDDAQYLAELRYGKPYEKLNAQEKESIDFELEFTASYHHEPVNSSQTSMQFSSSGNNGGGNQAGVDLWTYYSRGNEKYNGFTDFAIIESGNTGIIKGEIFYDGNKDATYQKNVSGGSDQPLKDVKVILVDANGNRIYHTLTVPVFDRNGFFARDDNGNIIYETIETPFEAVTNANGVYTFTGVPYPETGSATYYVQALLTDVQTDVLEYLPTTNQKAVNAGYLKDGTGATIPSTSGPDGTSFTIHQEQTASEIIFTAEYARNENGETVFDKASQSKQSVSISKSAPNAKFKDIGYTIGVPLEFQRDYKVVKNWEDGTQPLSSVTIELYYWNPNENSSGESSRSHTGELIGKAKLSAENDWKYTWEQLDSRLQYYFIEYYKKTMDDGTVYYTDKDEERLVLIGGTMPIFSSRPSSDQLNYEPDLFGNGEYNGHPISEEPKHYFGDTVPAHPDATTELEKRITADCDALLYDFSYNLTVADNTYITTFTNAQTYDEREYYVWLNHERELPDFICKTLFNSDGSSYTAPLALQSCSEEHEGHTSQPHIKGLTVTSLDSQYPESTIGNATDCFRLREDGSTSVYFTADNSVYQNGTGTRTFRCEYTVDGNGDPVAVSLINGVPVPSDPTITDYRTYTWTLTIHVYDVQPDETFYYDPLGGTVTLQNALPSDTSLTWQWNGDSYVSDDTRTRVLTGDSLEGSGAVFGNDIYRVSHYESAVQHLMDTCADVVGIAYSPDGVYKNDVDAEALTFWDTKNDKIPTVTTPLGIDGDNNPYGEGGAGRAEAFGKGGTLDVMLNPSRTIPLAEGQDHLNYATISFTPNQTYDGYDGDVFYYKTVVYSDDRSYENASYDELDATRGVVMYTYIRVKPIEIKGTLSVSKNVVGSAYSEEQPCEDSFAMTVSFTAPADKTVQAPISYHGGADAAGTIEAGWSGTKEISFNLRKDDEIVFENIEGGITYKVCEDDLSAEGFALPVYTFAGESETHDSCSAGDAWEDNFASGMITDASDAVTVTNTKNISLRDDKIVIDYGLPVEIHVLGSDYLANHITGIGSAVAADTSLYNVAYDASRLAGEHTSTRGVDHKIQLAHGTAYLTENGTIVYTPTDMQMSTEDVIYYEYTTENGEIFYSTVTVIPAANMYYEFPAETQYYPQDYITFNNGNGYNWEDVGTTYDRKQAEDRPGENALYDGNNVYGYDPAYNDTNDVTYSMGSARKATVDAGAQGKEPTMEFTFSGTGFDFFGLTDNQSGVMLCQVYNSGSGKLEKNFIINSFYGYTYAPACLDTETGEQSKEGIPMYKMPTGILPENTEELKTALPFLDKNCGREVWEIPTYWTDSTMTVLTAAETDYPAYAADADGARRYISSGHTTTTNQTDRVLYFAPYVRYTDFSLIWSIPTYRDANGAVTFSVTDDPMLAYGWFADGGDSCLYQVPVIRCRDLDYGTYRVLVTPKYMKILDRTGVGAYSVYVDAIRIYSPAGAVPASDSVIGSAYIADKEYQPEYREIRKNMLDADTFYTGSGAEGESGVYAGFSFIDGIAALDGSASGSISNQYLHSGPNNELYLAKDQAVACYVRADAAVAPAALQLGMKAITGSTGTLTVYNSNTKAFDTINVEGSSEQYRDLLPYITWDQELLEQGIYRSENPLLLINRSEAMISLTSFKTTVDNNDSADNQARTRFISTKSIAKDVNALLLQLPAADVAKQEIDLAFTSASVTLKSDLALNFFVPEEKASQFTGVYALFGKAIYDEAGNVTGTADYPVYDYTLQEINGVQCRCYTFNGIAPQEIGSKVTAQLHGVRNGNPYQGTALTYSVQTYVQNMLAKSDDAALHTLLSDLLNYGAAAQIYTGYRMNDLANADLSADQQARANSYLTAPVSCTQISGEQNTAVSFRSATLILRDKISINVSLRIDRSVTDISDLEAVFTFTDKNGKQIQRVVNGSEFVPNQSGCTVTFDGLNAALLRTPVTVTIRNATSGETVSNTLTYSVESYAASKQGSEDVLLTNLLRAMMNYGDSAAAYVQR